MLGQAVTVNDNRVGSELREVWRHASLAALDDSVWRFERVRRVLAALAPIPVVLFKGFALAELIYPSPAERLMGDVDLLIAPEQLAEALRRLTDLGFVPEKPLDLERNSSFEWTFTRTSFALDVHRGFSYPARLRVESAAVFARTIPWRALGSNARLLSPEDAVLVQALQAPLAEFAPAAAPAMGAWDVRLMLRRDGPFWGKVPSPPLDRARVRQRAEDCGASRLLYAGLCWVERLFPDTAETIRGLLPELPPRLARAIDEQVVACACPPRLETPSTRERMRRRWHLVPPGDRLAVLRQMAARRLHAVRRLDA